MTDRSDVMEVVIDALRTYEWILYEQTLRHDIACPQGRGCCRT